MKPPLKWVGGKRRLLSQIKELLPANIDFFVEPFVGGGAVFFAIEPLNGVIADVNTELCNFYTVLQEDPAALIDALAPHQNDAEYYYNIRAWDREPGFSLLDPVLRASRFLFLNKTCFNGMWRVNPKGYMNVPHARPKSVKLPSPLDLYAASMLLQNIEVLNCSFDRTIEFAKPGACFYLDPPYVPISVSESFTGYSKDGFNFADQQRLVRFCRQIVEAGATFVLSNSDCETTRQLYSEFNVTTVSINRTVGGKGSDRKLVTEILVTP